MRPVRVLCTVGILAFAPALLAAAAEAQATPGQVVAALNAQRAANGIPAGLTLNQQWSAACRLHNGYDAANHVLTHVEDPDKPGYTADGAAAGLHSDLAEADSWSSANPFEAGPLHLADMLRPQLKQIGFDNSRGYMCVWTGPGLWNHPENRLYTYPGDGTSGFYYAERASEAPTTPAQQVGLSGASDRTTGPYLILLADGPWLLTNDPFRIETASLRGPAGDVPIAVIDGTRVPAQDADYYNSTGFVLPLAPLRPNTTYHASVTASSGGVSLSRSWSFTTGDRALGAGGQRAGDDTSTAAGSRAGSPSGTASLTSAVVEPRTFPAARATRVKVLYGFSETAVRFTYVLERKSAGRWLLVNRGAESGLLGGVRSKTVAQLFGRSRVLPGQYRARLGCDGHAVSKTISFTVTR